MQYLKHNTNFQNGENKRDEYNCHSLNVLVTNRVTKGKTGTQKIEFTKINKNFNGFNSELEI